MLKTRWFGEEITGYCIVMDTFTQLNRMEIV